LQVQGSGVAQMQHRDTHDGRTGGAQSPHRGAQVEEVINGELCEGAPYGGAQLAQELAIAESTLRTRWMPWLEKVAPLELLKTEAGYTELARSLAQEFRAVPSKKTDREAWVSDAKRRCGGEFSLDGLIPEGLPSELGSAFALVRQQGTQMQTAATADLEKLKALITQQGQVQADFDEAEVQAIRARGMNRGVQRFQIETEAEDSAYFQLRRLRSQANS
jgi:hypothetical protein